MVQKFEFPGTRLFLGISKLGRFLNPLDPPGPAKWDDWHSWGPLLGKYAKGYFCSPRYPITREAAVFRFCLDLIVWLNDHKSGCNVHDIVIVIIFIYIFIIESIHTLQIVQSIWMAAWFWNMDERTQFWSDHGWKNAILEWRNRDDEIFKWFYSIAKPGLF